MRGTGGGFLKGGGTPGLADVPKTKELRTKRHKPDGRAKARKKVFINCILKLVF